jgi:ketosteroid isomerase-like protein
MSELERRVRRLEDRVAIADLLARYANAVDDRDIALVGECFCEDGVFGRWNGTDRAEGREAVEQFYRERLAGTGPSFHYTHGAELSFESDDHARGVVTAHAEMSVGGRLLIAAFRYMDQYRRDPDSRWRFLERLTRFYYFMPHDELDHSYAAPHRITFPGPSMPADLPDELATWKLFTGMT